MTKRKISTFERLNSGRMNRKERRKPALQVAAADPGLSIIHPNAAGIDAGNASHFVAVPPDRDQTPVRAFQIDDVFDFATEADRDKIRGGNAIKLFRFST
jgi:hypothetical protein